MTVLTGFLGAGKTTLLNRILADPAVTDTAVIVNEFGEAGIDHLLVETARNGIIELGDGCLCCTIRGDLVDTLVELADRMPKPESTPLKRVIVETTGLADPTPVLVALMRHPALREAYALDGVVTVVDALAGSINLATRDEARRQVAVADRLVITKSDLSTPAVLSGLAPALGQLNPRAPVLDASKGEATAASLLGCGLYDPETKSLDVRRWLQEDEAEQMDADRPSRAPSDAAAPHHHHSHSGDGPSSPAARHGAIGSFSIRREPPIGLAALDGFLDLLRATRGTRVLRMKAIVHTIEDAARPLVLHGVRGYLHPPVRLPAWPAGSARCSRLVIIGEALDETSVRDLFAAFAGDPRLGAPDRQALIDNPLAVAGVTF